MNSADSNGAAANDAPGGETTGGEAPASSPSPASSPAPSPAQGPVRWYILFANYEQGLALHDLLDRHGLPNRIAPAPRSIQGELSCGMSLLVEDDAIGEVRACIEANRGEYHSIVPLAGQIQSRRDRYC